MANTFKGCLVAAGLLPPSPSAEQLLRKPTSLPFTTGPACSAEPAGAVSTLPVWSRRRQVPIRSSSTWSAPAKPITMPPPWPRSTTWQPRAMLPPPSNIQTASSAPARCCPARPVVLPREGRLQQRHRGRRLQPGIDPCDPREKLRLPRTGGVRHGIKRAVPHLRSARVRSKWKPHFAKRPPAHD